MSPEESWSNAEIVRALSRIEKKLEDFATHFVARELYETEQHAQNKQHEDLAKWVTDIAAAAERTNRQMSGMVDKSTARWVVGTLVALIVGLATVLTMIALH